MNKATALLLALFSGCAIVSHPEVPFAPPDVTAPRTWDDVVRAGPIEHEVIVSGRWAVELKGMVNLEREAARELKDRPIPIVLPVHVLKHPKAGTFIIDTGTTKAVYAEGLVKDFLKDIEVVESAADIVERLGGIDGVLITHAHLDHVLGLPEIPRGTPIYVGPGELSASAFINAFTRGTYQKLVEGHEAFRVWPFESASEIDGLRAIDVFGDGSLFALSTPGHTPGSTAFLAMSTSGPLLFTGDTSHTLWGWEHEVEPGEFTADHDANLASLKSLRSLHARFPAMKVFVGHELDGEGTGVTSSRSAP